MTEITITEPHGYLFDSEGRVCVRFGEWPVGKVEVPDYVDARRSPEYVDGPAAHDKQVADKYRPDI